MGEKSEENHGFLKIFSKVIKEEMKLREANEDYMGKEEPPSDHIYKSHEFSSSFCCAMGDSIKKFLEEKYENIDDWLDSQLSRRLIRRDITKLATTKKSAVGNLNRQEHVQGEKENQRQTCLESCMDMLK